jgi:hypothetical protein
VVLDLCSEAEMAKQMGLLGRVELQQEFDQARLREQKLRILHSIGTSIAAALDLEEVLTRIVEAAVFITRAEEGSLLLLDEQTNELQLRSQKGLGDKYARGFRMRAVDNIAGEVIETGKPQRLTSANRVLKVVTGYIVNSILYVPVAIKGEVIGVLAVDNQSMERSFSEDDENLLLVLAGYAAIALENARLREELEVKSLALAGLSGTNAGEPGAMPDPSSVGLVLYEQNESGSAQSLSPRYVAEVLAPFLESLAETQHVIDEVEGNPSPEIGIVAITQTPEVPASMVGITRAIDVLRETVEPWKQEIRETKAQLLEGDRAAALARARAERLAVRARASTDHTEREQLLAEAGQELAQAEEKDSRNEMLRAELQHATLKLAFDTATWIAPGLPERDKLPYVMRLLPAVETILSSPFTVSTIQETDGLDETAQG